MTGDDRISVIIPVRDGERYLDEALGSVLGQTRPPDQVVVVDDGSRDDSAAVAEAYGDPVECVRRGSPGGPGAALNDGLTSARGNLLAFLDADDLWTKKKTELQLARLQGDAELDLVVGHVEHFLSPDLDIDEWRRLSVPKGSSPATMKGTMLIRRTSFERVGPFTTRFKLGEFVDWYFRAKDAGLRQETVPETVLRRRLHSANLGRVMKDSRQQYAKVIAEFRRSRRPSPEE